MGRKLASVAEMICARERSVWGFNPLGKFEDLKQDLGHSMECDLHLDEAPKHQSQLKHFFSLSASII
jgi:hypothetical protein